MTNELIDRNESPVKVGDQVEVRLPTYIGHIVICNGPVEYRTEDVGCYGHGYGINDPQRGFTYLSSISKSTTKMIILRPLGHRPTA
ncbi:hypothetical protein BSK65_04905 [Paenibacillus odorifer]|uniref:Uncharacterized protein n=1 Tax=Paenibacillus odorifer TaxID=189426 RepID=A0A1R0ZLQ4_9BACL|nr:hypothetical protein [Paenibacillus odorifer]OME73142.1 hypothetical protein BSK65_04905 [Paenibacillus odorifer]